MNMATALEDFPSWLSRTLEELNTDESVFGAYIQSILDSDETSEEKSEALQGILSEIVENEEEINKVCNDILEKWQFHKRKEPPPQRGTTEDVDSKLVKLLESQSLATTKQKKYTEEEKKIREAILSQYSQMTDDEDEVEDGTQPRTQPADHKENSLEKNTNVQSVLHAEKVKREQAKLDSQKKKEKDKEDREKQKQLREEKKEKRKTQKGERRR